jgi:hypothetical protein
VIDIVGVRPLREHAVYMGKGGAEKIFWK